MSTGAVVAGRGTFEPAGGWGGDHHDGVPIFVLSRHEPGIEVGGWPLVTYLDDVETAMGRAKRAAGGKDVLVHGAAVAQLALAAGRPRRARAPRGPRPARRRADGSSTNPPARPSSSSASGCSKARAASPTCATGWRDERPDAAPADPGRLDMTTVEVNGIALGVEHFGDAAAPPRPARGRHDDALLARRAVHGARARRAPRRALRPPRRRRVDHRGPRGAGVHPARSRERTPRRSPAGSTSGRRTWRASAWAGWSPRSPRSTTRTPSPHSPSPGRGPSPPARSTTTCPTTTRRRWGRLFSRPTPDWSDRVAVAEFMAAGARSPR